MFNNIIDPISGKNFSITSKSGLNILKKYSPLLKKGGKLVYATCSILPSENEIQIEKFLKSEEGKNFDFEDENKINPSDGFDGFYMARLALKQTC